LLLLPHPAALAGWLEFARLIKLYWAPTISYSNLRMIWTFWLLWNPWELITGPCMQSYFIQ
jgi:hypothetical protein